ncbi:type III-A CRISPR-associated protein Csm2 [Emticicia sp. 17c]|uniref:type III-A CRISPR-associated protein Csm2 n=1 Tax=Emticicia sp. 17c TaxID=3127704 RepID=UPI00301C2E1B
MSDYKKNNKEEIGWFLKNNQEKILTISLKDEELIPFMNDLEDFVKKDGKYLSNGQVRVIFELINETTNVQELQLARPKIAFVAAKQINNSTRELINKFLDLLAHAQTNEQQKSVKRFMTSFLHYHKFFHGDKKQ